MLRIAKLTDYGTVLLTEMARHPARIVSAAALAKRVNIAEATVCKLLKQLTAGGILNSHRGKGGGYQLKANPEEITLAQVLTVLEGQLAVTECSAGHGVCRLEAECAVRDNWRRINQAIYDGLNTLTLATMTRPLSIAQKLSFHDPVGDRATL